MKTKTICALSFILIAAYFTSAQTAAPCGGAQHSLAINWLQGNFDPCLTNNNPYETKLSPSTVGNLTLYWHGSADYSISAPIVVNGVMYFYNRSGKVEARNATNGNVVWQHPVAPTTNYFYLASPAVANGILYAGDGAGVLWALKASDGTLLWKYVTASQYTFAPTVSSGVVYVTETYSHPSYTYALDATTGSLLWKVKTGDTQGVQPAVSGNRVYTGGDYYGLVALDAKTGTTVWMGRPIGTPLFLAVRDGRVYVKYELLNLYALNAATGEALWNSPKGPPQSIALANGRLYASAGNGALFALDAYTGNLLWETPPTDAGPELGMAVANGIIYSNIAFDSNDVRLIAVDGATGATLWSYETGVPSLTGPVVVNGTLYAPQDNALFVFHLPSE